MAYQSEFYHISNIIGYTGELHRQPTVYFRCDQKNLIGRITQQHSLSFNVGRSQPDTSIGYRWVNALHKGRIVLHEYYANGGTHISRNPFIPIDPNTVGARGGFPQTAIAVLAQCLWRCPHAKDCADLNTAQWAQLKASMKAKQKMLWNIRAHQGAVGNIRPSNVAYVEAAMAIGPEATAFANNYENMQRQGRVR